MMEERSLCWHVLIFLLALPSKSMQHNFAKNLKRERKTNILYENIHYGGRLIFSLSLSLCT